jgi:hypothetical protein
MKAMGEPGRAESPEEVERIDTDIPIRFAGACSKSGIEHISLLSSIGANPDAK